MNANQKWERCKEFFDGNQWGENFYNVSTPLGFENIFYKHCLVPSSPENNNNYINHFDIVFLETFDEQRTPRFTEINSSASNPHGVTLLLFLFLYTSNKKEIFLYIKYWEMVNNFIHGFRDIKSKFWSARDKICQNKVFAPLSSNIFIHYTDHI